MQHSARHAYGKDAPACLQFNLRLIGTGEDQVEEAGCFNKAPKHRGVPGPRLLHKAPFSSKFGQVSPAACATDFNAFACVNCLSLESLPRQRPPSK